ncbi:MAG UNVERIFIED_CONTAM: hypothetical protein LVR18_40120 [Planctomycetaceae bacterium]
MPYPPVRAGWIASCRAGHARALQDSLELVRTLLLPNWDVHPEMITHTRVIDLKTGRTAGRDQSGHHGELVSAAAGRAPTSWRPYLAYALRILRNCGLPCEGVTTPGGFGNRVKPELSLAVQQAVRDVYQVSDSAFLQVCGGWCWQYGAGGGACHGTGDRRL